MMKDKDQRIWLEINITTPLYLADAVGTYLTDLTGQGIKWAEEETADGSRQVKITGYLAPEQTETTLLKRLDQYLRAQAEIFPELHSVKIETNPLPEEDWECAWQEFFKSLKVTEKIVIKPSWEDYNPQKGEIIIEIDPGRAFGTGHHPSTYLVLKNIQRLFEQYYQPRSISPTVLDVGTGTGILAIAALKFGATKALGLDIDYEAIQSARENAARNGVYDRFLVANIPLWEIKDSFDLILANISAYTLKSLASYLAQLLKPKGHLLLSGFLKEDVRDLKKTYEELGLSVIHVEVDPEFAEWAIINLYRN